jgi:hypothetical protein
MQLKLINIPKEWILSREVLTGLEVNANYSSNVFANSYSTYNTLIPLYGGYFVTPLLTQ